jgi:hypothetical protein
MAGPKQFVITQFDCINMYQLTNSQHKLTLHTLKYIKILILSICKQLISDSKLLEFEILEFSSIYYQILASTRVLDLFTESPLGTGHFCF